MKVYKFGGASVSDADGIRNVAGILGKEEGQQLMVIVSAMGKTTNALEVVAEDYYSGQQDLAIRSFHQLYLHHLHILRDLVGKDSVKAEAHLEEFRTEIEWLLHDRPVRSFDYYYDQIVCVGELMSSVILAAALRSSGLKVQWLDVRDIIRTDDNFREAVIDLEYTASQTDKQVGAAFNMADIVLTQGFIGATDENESTTLGREGSDYTAAVFAKIMGADSLTIWKDVPGVMNADPRISSDAMVIPVLSYDEAVEMTFFGAKVIHPKTLQPLRDREIPLYVRSFIDPETKGTMIGPHGAAGLPPVIIRKSGQVMIEFSSRDGSFLRGRPLTEIFDMLARWQISPNMMLCEALSIQVSADDRGDRIDGCCQEAAASYEINISRGLSMLTIRHANNELIEAYSANGKVLLRQAGRDAVHLLFEAEKVN
jgi:aspartate kinase